MTGDQNRRDLLGSIIRRQRELAEMPLRQVAAAVGISNPYLSQIERGLRAPSDAVLEGIAKSLKTTSEALFAEAGFAEDMSKAGGEPDLLRSIDAASELTAAQRRALRELYQACVTANESRRHGRST